MWYSEAMAFVGWSRVAVEGEVYQIRAADGLVSASLLYYNIDRGRGGEKKQLLSCMSVTKQTSIIRFA